MVKCRTSFRVLVTQSRGTPSPDSTGSVSELGIQVSFQQYVVPLPQHDDFRARRTYIQCVKHLV